MPVVKMTDVVDGVSVDSTTVVIRVDEGARGPAGPQGDPGVGVPTGGTSAQVLAKASSSDYDTHWVDQTGGGGGGAVSSVNGLTGTVVLAASDVGADASGAAATAQSAAISTAEGYTDTAIASEVTRADAAYDDAGAAATAQSTALAAIPAPSNGNPLTLGTADPGTGTAYSRYDHKHPMPSASDVGAATTAQGGKADTAVQPGSLSTVATTGAYSDLSGKPTLGTAAAKDIPASGNASATQVVYGSDTRLSDARTPTAHKTTHATGGTDALAASDIGAAAASHTHPESDVTNLTTDLAAKLVKASNLSDLGSASTARTNLGLGTAAVVDVPASGNASSAQVVKGNDTRLSDSRTPTAHASTHASAGSDPITIAESQVTNLTTDLAAKAPLASPALTGTPTVPTATSGTNTTQAASTAFVQTASGLLVPKSTVTTKGDLIVATASATVARQGVGSDGQVLTADSSQTNGIKWATPSSAAIGAYPFYTGTYYSYDGLTNAAGTGTWASGSMGYSPFRVGVASASFDRFSVQCNTVGAGSQLRVGVYAADATTGKPGALVLDAGTIIPAATGEQFASISLTLTRGDYWLAVLSEATGTGTWDIKNSVMTPNPFGRGGALIGATQNRGIQSTGVSSGGLPNPAPSQTIGTPADPIPYLRAA